MKDLRFRQIKRILIRSTNWVGDAVITTPAIRAVRKNFPEAKISLLAKPWVAPIFYNNPYIDNI
ncbi:MAG: glycosyltransferase family 9 protein, partial [Desulfobacteraceae bacterium]|nr:glycosyltransferase family 9 protein [Desulfobacteraceae bacterium]MBC2718976.1 lipopolysaccharide heptosyltransferase II [Desulfobacteraceae bacterium]